MVCSKQHRIAKGIFPITLFCILIACTYQRPLLKTSPVKPPYPIAIKPKTPVGAPDTPSLEIPVPATSEPRIYLHKVRWAGETLSHIAKWYTGAIKNWKAIAKVNSELDPKKIDVGDTIAIPEVLLTSRKSMPHSFIRASLQKKAVPLSSSKKILIPLESTKLFGPIESEPSTIETDSSELFGPVESEQSSIEPDTAKLFGPIE